MSIITFCVTESLVIKKLMYISKFTSTFAKSVAKLWFV